MRALQSRAFLASLLLVLCVAVQVPAQTATVSDVVVFSAYTFGNPAFSPAQGRNGLLYGVLGGSNENPGTVFDFSMAGATHTLSTANPASGYGQFSPLTLATDGNFYGAINGAAVIGAGANGDLFKVTPNGTFSIVHVFAGADGLGPLGAPIEASDGNLYGTTWGGCCTPSTVYKYTPEGVFSVIYTFDSAHGTWANSIIQGPDGNLYVTCNEGGASDNGTVVKLTTVGKLLDYYSFPGGAAGGSLPGGLVLASDGNYYGSTLQGGAAGDGTIYRLTPDYKVTTLYTFNPRHNGGKNPGFLILATDGYLYGVSGGGLYGNGAIFRISTKGAYSQIYSFPSSIGSDATSIMQDTSGEFYGTTWVGSTYNYGAIYSLDMGLGPFIKFVRPSGTVGQAAQILGQGLTGTTSVTFNGLPASSFSVVSDTYMTAVVPSGATTGPVVVTMPTGPLTSNVSFRISK